MRLQLLAPVWFLIAASLTTLSSISRELFTLQLLWVALGTGLILLFWFFDWRSLFNYRWLVYGLYAIAILFLAITLFEPPIRNVKSWFVLGPITIQPVELAKLALILLYAQYFSRRHIAVAYTRNILASFLYFAIPASLVVLQPDLGSTLILFGIWFGFLLVSGLPRNKIVLTLVIFAIAGLFIWVYGLQEYQKERIAGVFYPERNALSINYSVIQSKIAIGSAGFLGKGYGQGTQTQLGFLTEPATDFIFAALIEEWGWMAGIATVAALLFLIIQTLKVGILADRNFEKFVCLGSALVWGWQFFLNAGSATGIFPVVGVPFPFLSYGGSSLLTNFFLLAIIHAIALRS